MTDGEIFPDDTWNVASETVQHSAHIPDSLPHLIRGCWNNIYTTDDFLRLAAHPEFKLDAIIHAAHIETDDALSSLHLREAVDKLGVKAASLILGINSICKVTLNAGPANKVWTPLFREMMSEVEIGYHLGLCADSLGHDHGMLVGFSRLAGLIILLTAHPKGFSEWLAVSQSDSSHTEALRLFGCEPYQVSAILMQHLGLGPEAALATAFIHGNIQFQAIEKHSDFSSWSAAHHWIKALKDGHKSPDDRAAKIFFPDLLAAEDSTGTPLHLQTLYEEVERVRLTHSNWTWHLPLRSYEETAEAMVYRINSDASGNKWTKTLPTKEERVKQKQTHI